MPIPRSWPASRSGGVSAPPGRLSRRTWCAPIAPCSRSPPLGHAASTLWARSPEWVPPVWPPTGGRSSTSSPKPLPEGNERTPRMSRFPLIGSQGAAALGALLLLGAAPPPPPGEPVDLGVVTRIRQEAFQRSQVADVVRHLSDRIGARLTAS